MANIELLTSIMEDGLEPTCNLMVMQIEDVMDSLKKIQKQLNNQVEAKMSIDNRFNRLQNLLKKEKEYISKAGKLSVAAYAELDQIDKQQANVFKGTEKVPSSKSNLKSVITKNYASKYGSMSGFLLASGSALSMANLSKWNTKMATMNKNMKATNAAIQKETQAISKQTTSTKKPAASTTTNKTTTTTKNSNQLVTFDNKKYKSYCKNKEGYSNYTILSGVKTEYIYCQGNYTKKGFAKLGCYSTADAIVQSIGKQKKYNPTDTWNVDKQLSQGLKSQKLPGKDSRDFTIEEMRTATYEQLQKGNPVMLRVYSRTAIDKKGNEIIKGHSVVAVGIRNGANPKNLTDEDILIVDPGDGKIKTLAERKRAEGATSALITNSGYSMRIPS